MSLRISSAQYGRVGNDAEWRLRVGVFKNDALLGERVQVGCRMLSVEETHVVGANRAQSDQNDVWLGSGEGTCRKR